jgi:hypothetical protein
MARSREQARERQAAEQAARELQRGRVADRMRENARDIGREGGGEPGQKKPEASAQQEGAGQEPTSQDRATAQGQNGQVSSTLERVAERLGAAGSAETRRLANEMARNRAARERLEESARRLERAQREGDPGAQAELRREMQRAEQMLRDLQRGGNPNSGTGESTPEQHEWSRSAPGLESFKQDLSRWEQLKRDITLALERRDLALARQLRGRDGDKVNAGSVEALSESYRAKVARYFEALARAGRRNP